MKRMMELKDQSVEELEALYQDLSRELFQMKNELSVTRKLDKPHLIGHKKKERARVMTLLNAKGKGIRYEG